MGAREGRGSSDAPEPRLGKRWSRANPRAVAGVPLHPMRPDENRMRGPETKANHPPTQTGSKLQTHTHTQTRTHAYTPETHNCKNAHSRARTHATTGTNFSREEQYTEMPPPPLPTPSTILCPFLKNKKQKPSYHSAKDCQNFRMRTNETYRNRPFVWIILYIKCSKSCLMSTYNETFFS